MQLHHHLQTIACEVWHWWGSLFWQASFHPCTLAVSLRDEWNVADGALRAEQPFTAHPCYDRHSDRLVAFSNGIRHGEGIPSPLKNGLGPPFTPSSIQLETIIHMKYHLQGRAINLTLHRQQGNWHNRPCWIMAGNMTYWNDVLRCLQAPI